LKFGKYKVRAEVNGRFGNLNISRIEVLIEDFLEAEKDKDLSTCFISALL